MKYVLTGIFLFSIICFIISCESDQGLLPKLSFKTGTNYISKDTILIGGTSFTIGINASKSENEDVLKKFNISKSINGTTNNTVFSKDLSGSEGDNFTYDYSEVLDTIHGQSSKFIFTISNRDGLINQDSLTISIL